MKQEIYKKVLQDCKIVRYQSSFIAVLERYNEEIGLAGVENPKEFINAQSERINALEEGLREVLIVMSGFGGIEAWVNDRETKENFQAKYYPAIEKAKNLLNK